jgi:serine/threonine-protein kinase
MDPERWASLQRMFHEALERPPEARASYLAEIAKSDPQAAEEVRALLSAGRRAVDDVFDPATSTGGLTTLAPGTRLGPYEVVSRIGAGGMGEVYQVVDTRLDRSVAVKVIRMPEAQRADRRERFQREARAISRLSHPHICALFDVGEQDGLTYLVMEHLEGQTLAERLVEGSLPVEQVLLYGREMAEALEAAHRQGVVHRDLKPANVMLTRDGVKLLDFGLAKLRAEERAPAAAAHTLTQTGMVMGTLPYMSPEQLQGGDVDARTDIFALGAVLYEMTTGRRPFAGDTEAALIAALLSGEPAPFTGARGQAVPALERVVRRCLAKDREQRWPSARDVAEELRSIADGRAGRGRARWIPRWSTRTRWLAAAGLLLLGLALVPWLRRGPAMRDGPATAPSVHSIAVLPLRDLSPEKAAEDYFADGMTEALIADLARISSLHVISRTSVMRFKDTRESLPDIARQLGVDGLIEGSVLRSGGRVRITAQLVHGATDRHLWVETYDRDLRDVLTLQGEVARAIADQVRVVLTPEERARLSRKRTVDPEAHEAYIKGRFYWNKRTTEGLQQALSHFQKAIEKDPALTLGYVGLADTYATAGFYGYDAIPPAEAMPKAEAAARKALEIDVDSAEAHTSLGRTKHYTFRWSEAGEEFQRALGLNPNYSLTHQWYGHYLTTVGQHDRAIATHERARQLDPLNLQITVALGVGQYMARRFDDAVATYRKTLEMDPRFARAHFRLGQVHAARGEYGKAVKEYETYASVTGGDPLSLAMTAHALGRLGEREKARAILARMQQAASKGWVPTYRFALVYIGLGDRERAMDWLEKAYEERSTFLISLAVDPMLDPLRSDRRFQELLRRVGPPGGATQSR